MCVFSSFIPLYCQIRSVREQRLHDFSKLAIHPYPSIWVDSTTYLGERGLETTLNNLAPQTSKKTSKAHGLYCLEVSLKISHSGAKAYFRNWSTIRCFCTFCMGSLGSATPLLFGPVRVWHDAISKRPSFLPTRLI